MAKILVTGTPGSGKSTVLEGVKIIKIISFADEMLKISSANGVIDRDRLRYMTYEEIALIRKSVIENTINRMDEDLLIDTHLTVKKKTRYVPGFSRSDLDMMKDLKGIIYIDAHANDIMFRRLTDKTRSREDEPEEEIHEQRRINISIASYYAAHLNLPLYIVKNRQNQVEIAIKDLEDAIKEITGKGI